MNTKDTKSYLNPSLTVDVALFTIDQEQLKVLLIERNAMPFKGQLALPGGFLLKGETMEQGVARLVSDKAGVENIYFEQLYTFGDLNRDPRGPVFSVTYFALAPREKIIFNVKGNTQSPNFYPVKNLPKLAFDHSKIVSYAHQRLQAKIEYTNVAYSLLPQKFTLTQLQKIYEIILERKLDKRNFRKKYEQLGLLKDTGTMLRGERQRPAKLYSFATRQKQDLRKFF